MDPEIKRQLEEIHALARDNHHMLRAIRRHQWYSVVWTIIFWLVILVTPFYLYQQYLQPLVSKFSAPSSTTTSTDTSTFAEIQKLINSFKTQ